jgi:SAM-dependent methyltransferase
MRSGNSASLPRTPRRSQENSLNDFFENTRTSYDHIAAEYAEHIFDELKDKPLDRALLDRFAEAVLPLGIAVDMGCGPGQIARYLSERGLPVIGVDLAPRMVTLAKALTPRVDFRVGNMLALDAADGAWGGIAAFYSIIHIPRVQIVAALREFKRVLMPRGVLLLAFHRGHEIMHPEAMWGKPVNLDFIFFERSEMETFLCEAGFDVLEVSERVPYPEVEHPSQRVYILARKP